MPGTVLVVDDDAAFRSLARRMLAGERLTVVGEADGVTAAIAAADRLRPDAVLVDVGLPDGDAFALVRRLCALPWHPRVVLTSSDPDAASAEDVRACGASAFVPKHDLPGVRLERLLAG